MVMTLAVLMGKELKMVICKVMLMTKDDTDYSKADGENLHYSTSDSHGNDGQNGDNDENR